MEIGGAIRQSANPPEAASAPPPPVATASARAEVVSRRLVEALASKAAENTRSGSKIRMDEATDRIVVQILNANGEVIKQIPPEELLRAIAKSREVTGLIFDQQT